MVKDRQERVSFFIMDTDLLNKLILQLQLKISSEKSTIRELTQDLEVIRAHINSDNIDIKDMGEPWVSKKNV